MICKHCNKPIDNSIVNTKLIVIQYREIIDQTFVDHASGNTINIPILRGEMHFHLECWKEIAGEDYIPAKDNQTIDPNTSIPFNPKIYIPVPPLSTKNAFPLKLNQSSNNTQDLHLIASEKLTLEAKEIHIKGNLKIDKIETNKKEINFFLRTSCAIMGSFIAGYIVGTIFLWTLKCLT